MKKEFWTSEQEAKHNSFKNQVRIVCVWIGIALILSGLAISGIQGGFGTWEESGASVLAGMGWGAMGVFILWIVLLTL